ncbi:MAG TPA: medium chain dehydrogenase/reductase family protein [Gemmatimonadaceae bacterium]
MHETTTTTPVRTPATSAMLPPTHRGVVLDRTGGPEVLRLATLPTPVPGPGEVLVRVAAAGVAFAQVMMRHGTYPYAPPFPFTPGAEVVGNVVAVGPEVSEWSVGDRVAAFSSIGGYAELALLSARSLVRVPDGLDAAAVAALPMNYVTAYQLLHRVAMVRAGETVLVHGAGGGVGTALLQLARLAGVTVVGTESPRKLALVRALGALDLDYTTGNVAARAREMVGPLDVVLDPIGGDHVLESARALRPGGRLVVYGHSAPGAATPEGMATLAARMEAWNADPAGIRALGYSMGALHRDSPDAIRDDLARLVALLAEGGIEPIIADRIPLADVRRAHEQLEVGGVPGKLVLVPTP